MSSLRNTAEERLWSQVYAAYVEGRAAAAKHNSQVNWQLVRQNAAEVADNAVQEFRKRAG